jgi:alkylated DNA repair dioxygenase AlkB
MYWQQSLFDEGRDHSQAFGGLQRTWLDEHSWVDYAPGWLAGHAELLDHLVAESAWQQRERVIHGRQVREPRLVVAWSAERIALAPRPLGQLRDTLAAHYRVALDSVLLNLYRDGADSVSWHGDAVRRRLTDAVVVTVALGARRRFLLRPGSGGRVTHRYMTGEGDLLVMGGRCQTDWQHTVPRQRAAGLRLSITMRHSRPMVPRSAAGQPAGLPSGGHG